MYCPMCSVSLSRQQETTYRVWACYNPDCPVTILIVDCLHPKSPWPDQVANGTVSGEFIIRERQRQKADTCSHIGGPR